MTGPVQDIYEMALGISSRCLSAASGSPVFQPHHRVAAAEVPIDAWDLAHGKTPKDAMRNDQDQRIWPRSNAPLAVLAWKGLGEPHSAKRRVTQRVV